MQNLITTLTGAICGAIIAVATVIVLTNLGHMPINETQLHAYLISHPQLVGEMNDAAQKIEDAKTAAAQAATMKKLGIDTFFDPRIAFVSGPADARNTLVEFYDYDCPFCRASNPGMIKFHDAHQKDTRFALIELPLSIHGPDAQFAARLSLAARLQPDKFFALHYALMGTDNPVDQPTALAIAKKLGFDMTKLQADMQRPEIEQILAASRDLARKAKIDGTPTFIINGTMFPGALDEDGLNSALQKS
jgi:protein-disulfide isomerase